MRFDQEASQRVLRSYRTPEIAAQREFVVRAVEPLPGERVLDVGSGPGLLAAELAVALGPEGSVAGIDLSEDMLAIARKLEPKPGDAPIVLQIASATELPFADAEFDAVVSTQVYEYVVDMPTALAEARRVLRPDGRLVILDTDWDSLVWHSSDDELRRRILGAWDEHLADPFLPRKLARLLREAGFGLRACSTIPVFNFGYQEEMFSSGLIEIVASFVAGRHGITEDEAQAWAADLKELGEDYFFSVNRYLFTATRPGE